MIARAANDFGVEGTLEYETYSQGQSVLFTDTYLFRVESLRGEFRIHTQLTNSYWPGGWPGAKDPFKQIPGIERITEVICQSKASDFFCLTISKNNRISLVDVNYPAERNSTESLLWL